MARPRNVTPRKIDGRPGWIASFYCADGKRVTRGLGTRNEFEARMIAAAISTLAAGQFEHVADAPSSTPRKALLLYFGDDCLDGEGQRIESPIAVASADAPDVDNLSAADARQVLRYHMLAQSALTDRDIWRGRYEALHRQHEALRTTVLARAAEAAANCPPMPLALEEFAVHMAASGTAKHARRCEVVARAFAAQLVDVATPAHITAEHIGRWLDADAAGNRSPASRRARQRVLLGRFVNWSADIYGFVSPMGRVKSATKQQLDRERGGIEWHELAEVTAALEQLPDDYWRAVVATLAFAGLRLAELIWLRVSDFQAAGDRHQLWITSVDDGHGERHDLKTGHSKRAVDVSQARLLPLLEAHIDAYAGELFLFPIHPDMRRRQRATGHPERWDPGSLSRKLSGIPWRKQAGVLPDGMTARSLRRTFGSLLLRSGRSVAEVAAAMGNTPAVVQQHYARILGSEVSVDF